MKRQYLLFLLVPVFLNSCSDNREIVRPSVETITESIYASGSIKSDDQYQVYPTVNGIVEKVFVEEGDLVKPGQPLFAISNGIQQLNKENAALSASFFDLGANREKLEDALQAVNLGRDKMRNDSVMYVRQLALFKQKAITKVELEQRELALENARNNYQAAITNYNSLKRQLAYNSEQAKRNLLISEEITGDYTVKSDIGGKVYALYRKKGELVGPQTPVAVVGNASSFVLEMQVDEYDITRVRKGQKVIISMDSYKGRTFEAVISKIDPMMNERTKSFTVEARFVKQPETLYPNFSFEANIIIRSKENSLLIPRKLLRYDNTVELSGGKRVKVKTGLRDYQKVEILSGLKRTDELIVPEE